MDNQVVVILDMHKVDEVAKWLQCYCSRNCVMDTKEGCEVGSGRKNIDLTGVKFAVGCMDHYCWTLGDPQQLSSSYDHSHQDLS